MRLIDADKLDECLQSMANLEWNKQVGSSKGLEDAIDIIYDAPTVNAIPIPENATNGQVIDAMFPELSMFLNFNVFEDEWWNTLYRRELHELKILPQYYKEVVSGKKNFELRKNDRDYQVGDILKLREYENGEYTGRVKYFAIKYILKDCSEYGLMDGYCILGL